MHIVNGTAHRINFYNEDQCTKSEDGRRLIRKPGETPIYTVEAGTNLNAEKGNAEAPAGDFPFNVKGAVMFWNYDAVPEKGDLVIVSNLYRAAVLELGEIQVDWLPLMVLSMMMQVLGLLVVLVG